jgi:hypothetical protein
MPSKLIAAVATAALALSVTAPAYAFDCFVAKKPPRAGAVGVVDVTTDEFTPLKNNPGTEEQPHGGFIALAVGDQDVASTFLHAPEGVLPPVREGGPQDNCDGKGLDSIEECFAQ